jgi:IS4 transposase
VNLNYTGEPLLARIVFVKSEKQKSQWLALLSTDLSLSEEEIVTLYGKRWDIEVFFKMVKSVLKLTREFQVRSYDALVSHTSIVFIRYIMLAVVARRNTDPRTFGELFYACYDEIQDITLMEALALTP